MDRRFIIFIALAVGILYASSIFNSRAHKPAAPAAAPAVVAPEKQAVAEVIPTEAASLPQGMLPVEKINACGNEKITLQISNLGGLLKGLDIKGFKQTVAEGGTIDLIGNPGDSRFLGVQGKINGKDSWPDRLAWQVREVNSGITLAVDLGKQLRLSKEIVLDRGKYTGKAIIRLHNGSSQPVQMSKWRMAWGPQEANPKSKSSIVEADAFSLGKKERFKLLKQATVSERLIRDGWIGFRDQYFCSLFYTPERELAATIIQTDKQSIYLELGWPDQVLLPGGGIEATFHFYWGPQDYTELKKLGSHLYKVVDFGMFHLIGVWMLYVLKFFYFLTGNYGLAIILLTLLIRGILWWPTQKSYTSMKKMQTAMSQMQPRLKTLKEIYKSDAKKLNEETMKLYREYQINPMGGCLPMLLQMPIFIALYATLSGAVELKGASFIWIWKDLSLKDPWYILPIVMGLTMFIQQKMSTPPAATDEAAAQQKMMLYLMPVMLTVFSFVWPSGLLLYWVVSNLISIGQQAVINRKV